MPLRARAYCGDADLARIDALLRVAAPATHHLVDMPWRLGSDAFQSADDVCLWVDEHDALLAFAAWQTPWAALDFVVRPGAGTMQIEDAIFAWAMRRCEVLDRTRGRPLPYWAEVRDDDAERLAALSRHGFDLNDDEGYVYMRRALRDAIEAPVLPEEYAIRPLAGESEVEAYVALHRAAFANTTMTASWRARTLRMPSYVPTLDLVGVAPDGALAGFCVCWLDVKRRLGQTEPIGVHPAYQHHGLARALMLEAFGRLRAHGAADALVETNTGRLAARRTYEAAGFEVAHMVLRKGRYVG